ncbi:MAG: IS110 family transposase, partial [Planctomycetales bacterium]|nr:IS110 family transposase [Planctomycetales bacterium]
RTKRRTIRGPWTDVADAIRDLSGKVSVCFEASTAYGYLYELLSDVADRVVVAHPGHLRLIFRSKQKNDRADAEKLAKLLFLDEVPPVYVPSCDVRSWRQLIEYRRRLIAKRTRTKNSLRSILRTVGQSAPKEIGLWTSRGISWLSAVDLPRLVALKRDLLIEELAMFERQIARAEKELESYSQGNPAVTLLRTIPGVGIRTAEAVAAYLDDPTRFSKSKAIGSYFGLVPRQDQSGSTNRLGHITRNGPSVVRQMLVEAAWHAIRLSPTIQHYFGRIEQDNRERKKIALVATAHYMARVMHAMLRDNRPWEETVLAA